MRAEVAQAVGWGKLAGNVREKIRRDNTVVNSLPLGLS